MLFASQITLYNFNKVHFFSLEETNFPVEDKLLPGHNMASSGLRKMLTLIITFNNMGVWVLVCPAIFMDTVVNGGHII